jgi:hypothetical protein
MRCRKAVRLASRGLDGVLSSPDAAALEQHLASCTACRLVAERMGHAWRRLAPLQQVGSAPDDWTRIETNLGARSRLWMALWPSWPLAGVHPAAAWALAAMMALGATGGALLSRTAFSPRRSGSLEAVAFTETLGDLPWGSPVADLAEPLLARLPAEGGP